MHSFYNIPKSKVSFHNGNTKPKNFHFDSIFITVTHLQNNPVGDYATFGHQDFNAMNIDSQLTSGHRLLGNILHLWMHIFGVPHMYTAPDRGFYMKICSDNIDKSK